MAFVGIDSVVFSPPDMKQARRFFVDWGLKRVRNGRSGTVFETEIGSQIVLRPPEAGGLPPAPPGGNFREVVWGVSSPGDLDAIARELARDREVTLDKDGTLHSVDPNGLGIGFRVWRHNRALKPSRAPVNSPGALERIDAPSRFYQRARPLRMGHVVFLVGNLKAGEKFYAERLGFWLSDRYTGGVGVFLRYVAKSDHHNLFLLRSREGGTDINHVAFEVRDIHEVFGGGLYMQRRGWPTEAGPGRHPISSAYFWYFKSPCGGSVEYFGDSDYMTEAWKPRAFRVNRFSEWHLADGITSAHGDADST
jgi:catechol 2,3-dioxygenase-like lactoylglutathione lyase family enzyme